jgi:archaemetzincin
MQELAGIIFLTLTIAPFEETDPQALADLIHDLSVLGLKIAQKETLPVPAEAYDPGRDQYIADVLLTAVQQLPDQHTIGVTDLDLYSGDLNFVFGLAQLPGKAAVISLYRLRYGADRDTFRKRAVTEVVHELGHTLGLHHCPDPRCVMHFSNRLADTDRKGVKYCERCRGKLQKRFQSTKR